MTSTLARQTAVVLVETLPDDFDVYNLFQPVQRIKKAELWQCFYTNQTLKVVQQPSDSICTYPYTIVYQGWLLERSDTYSLEKAIAYCDLCIKNIPEFSQPDLIPSQLSQDKKEKIEYEILKILAFLDQEYPDPNDIDLANMLVEIAS